MNHDPLWIMIIQNLSFAKLKFVHLALLNIEVFDETCKLRLYCSTFRSAKSRGLIIQFNFESRKWSKAYLLFSIFSMAYLCVQSSLTAELNNLRRLLQRNKTRTVKFQNRTRALIWYCIFRLGVKTVMGANTDGRQILKLTFQELDYKQNWRK